MSKRQFEIFIRMECTLELDQAVIDAVDDEWRDSLYPLHTPEDIAAMIGRNMIVHRLPLSSLDGWADQPNANAVILRHLCSDEATAIEV